MPQIPPRDAAILTAAGYHTSPPRSAYDVVTAFAMKDAPSRNDTSATERQGSFQLQLHGRRDSDASTDALLPTSHEFSAGFARPAAVSAGASAACDAADDGSVNSSTSWGGHLAGTGGTEERCHETNFERNSTGLVTDPTEIRKAKLLVLALAVQHVPEALACGVAFAAAATHHDTDGDGATLGAALSLTLAIALQDIPEGAMAAFVLRNLGWSRRDSFVYGQATGLVQPLAGVLGAAAVLSVESILPYALAFASAAMLFVVVKDMVPDVLNGSSSRNSLTLIMMGAFVFMAVASSLIDQLKL